MSQPSSPAQVYEQFFGPAIFQPLARTLVERATPRQGERALDLACGTGIVARHVAPLLEESGSVVGLDLSPDMLSVARALPPPSGAPVEWRQGSAVELPFADASFDLVLCQQGLQFFPDRAAALREVRRVSRPGARLALNLWQGIDRQPVYRAMMEAEARILGVPLSSVATPFSMGDPEELRALLESAGFQKVDITPGQIQARFASADQFVELTVRAAAAVIPQLQDDPAALASQVAEEIRDVVARHRERDHIAFAMPMHTALAS